MILKNLTQIKPPNKIKYAVLSTVFQRYLTIYEISVFLFEGDLTSPEFQAFYKKIGSSVNRYSKQYDPTKEIRNRGYPVPYLSKRWIKTKTKQKKRRGTHEYRATIKGRRMVCEWNYRIRLGHTSLKWTGDYFMPRNLCDGHCKTCLMNMV